MLAVSMTYTAQVLRNDKEYKQTVDVQTGSISDDRSNRSTRRIALHRVERFGRKGIAPHGLTSLSVLSDF